MKLKALTAGVMLAIGSNGAFAAISQGDATPGELYFEIWDGNITATSTSWAQDLGVTVDQFLNAAYSSKGGEANLPVSFVNALGTTTTGTLGSVAITLPAGTTLPSTSVFSIKAANETTTGTSLSAQTGPTPDQNPGNHTGMMFTVPTPITNVFTQYNSFVTTAAALSFHTANINGTDINWAANKFTTSAAGTPGHYLTAWNSTANTSLGVNTDGKLGTALPFYFFTTDQTTFSTGIIGNNGKAFGNFKFDPTTSTLSYTSANAVATPIPAAVWLFGSAMAGLVSFARRGRKLA